MADWSIILVSAADDELSKLSEELQARFLRIADMLALREIRLAEQRFQAWQAET